MKTVVEEFYRKYLPDANEKKDLLTASCPFCQARGGEGRIVVVLNKKSFFFGYFRCQSQCLEHGFVHWFASLLGRAEELPVLPDGDFLYKRSDFPVANINGEIDDFARGLQETELPFFKEAGISKQALREARVGFNGRYIVYPYEQRDGNAYSARCVHPDREDDVFWHGDGEFADGPTGLFHVGDLKRCAGGTLFLCEKEVNLLTVRQLGFPGVAYADAKALEKLDPSLFAAISTIFLVPEKREDSAIAARNVATRIGHKVRILAWQQEQPEGYSLRQCAVDFGRDFVKEVGRMMSSSRPFSPFPTPENEYSYFFASLSASGGEEYGRLRSGFSLLDERIGGVHGINILGGGPKVGKSCFMMQMAANLAFGKVPVLYYDFENGRDRIYQRTFIRMSRMEQQRLVRTVHDGVFAGEQFERAREDMKELLKYFRVINDRKISPETMRRHIDFLRHESRSDYIVVVIDSLHKLPFKDLAEMRTGIDSWLRELESIRDSLQVSFLVISELQRGAGGAYDDAPHMGIFKGSGDIEYSADNAMVLLSEWNHMQEIDARKNALWLVGSREHRPGLVGRYVLDYPYWGFTEEPATS